MKKIILIIVLLSGYLVYTHFIDVEKQDELKTQITISDLKNNPSTFSDSLVTLKNIYIVEASAVMNYSKSRVTDESDEEIILLSSKPYKKGEHIPQVVGKYILLFRDNNKELEVFISEDLKLAKDIIKVVKLFFLI